jgi:cellulose biosynthesis protein BcsQ
MKANKKIVITNEKGGTGKSTIACLLIEHLNHLNKKVQLIDTDPIQTSQTWADNCQAESRIVSYRDASYQIIDTAGSSGSALTWLKQADLILVPFQPHYADLNPTITWFTSLNSSWQAKIAFIPNRWQNTKEQREGINQLKQIIKEEKQGRLLASLSNRPALYGSLLNGGKKNFFAKPEIPAETKKLMEEILACV